MTQNEDKELLMKDLSARLQYGVKVHILTWNEDTMEFAEKVDELYSINKDGYIRTVDEEYELEIESVKPYLFPILSMTEEQKRCLFTYCKLDLQSGIDYLDKYHFDHRGLIEKGLAVDCSNLNIY